MKNISTKLDVLRHSISHILAAAVLEMFPQAKLAIGPAIEDGFYYDFDLPRPLTPDDLPMLEEKMRVLIAQNLPFEKSEIDAKKAIKFFSAKSGKTKQPYKIELVKDILKKKPLPPPPLSKGRVGVGSVTLYKSGPFVDLCSGPHIASTKEINPNAFKLTKIAGAYWRGDEKNKMLQRIYGVAFATKEELEKYLKNLEEAEKRDHRKLGKELDLFITSDLIGKGLPLLTPKGATIRLELEKFIIEEETKRGYLRTYTPDLAKVELYKKSGHWDHYKESMYPPIKIDNEDYVLRPMTCPHQFMIYNSRPRSYRELPLRYAEIAKQYRKEQSGELSGLIRVMCFSLVDAHIICRPDQVEEEFAQVVDLIQYGMRVLGIKNYWYRFSTWDPKNKKKYIDDPVAWEKTQASMKKILDHMKLDYIQANDEAAFYGPKLDVQLRNINGKEDTAFTVQIDFALPERFDMTYIDKEGKEERPMVIHRSSIGCLERTIAFLIERYAGAFPVWLAPEQVWVLPIGEKHEAYAFQVAAKLRDQHIRVVVKNDSETVSKKIRDGETQKIPYLLVVGDREISSDAVAVRERGKGDLGATKTVEFINKIKEEINKKI